MNERRMYEQILELRQEVDELKRRSQYNEPPPTEGRLRDMLMPPGQFLAQRYMQNAQPATGEVVTFNADGRRQWGPSFLIDASFPGFPSGSTESTSFRVYAIDEVVTAGLDVNSADTLPDPALTTGGQAVSAIYLIHCTNASTGADLGHIIGAGVPDQTIYASTYAPLASSDVATGPGFGINSSGGHHIAAHASVNTHLKGIVVVFWHTTNTTGTEQFNPTLLGNWDVSGTTGRIKLQTFAGTPTHSEEEGVLCWDTTNNILYANTGTTNWAAIANVSQLHTREHDMTATSDHTATAHRTFYSDGSGDIQALAHGTSGQIYTSAGASSAPTWADAGGGMKASGTNYLLPAGPAAGTTITKSATANTFGVPVTAGTTLGASLLTGISVEDWSVANNYGQLLIDCSPAFTAVSSMVGSTTTTLNITGPTCLDDDILIASTWVRNTDTITPPNGWTTFVSDLFNSGASRVAIHWKRAVASTDSGAVFAFTCTNTPTLGFYGNITGWRGCVTTGSPISGTPTFNSTDAAVDAITYATFTPGRAGAKVIAVGIYAEDNTTAGAMTVGDPMFANHADQESTTANDASIMIYGGVSRAGGATGALTHTTTSTADAPSAGVLFALVGDGGYVGIKLSAPSTAPTGTYNHALAVPAAVPGSARTIFAAWAGNNASADTCQLTLHLALTAQLTDVA